MIGFSMTAEAAFAKHCPFVAPCQGTSFIEAGNGSSELGTGSSPTRSDDRPQKIHICHFSHCPVTTSRQSYPISRLTPIAEVQAIYLISVLEAELSPPLKPPRI
jgi:hypothetical protein